MFVNCPFCRGLVATDPATDQPPERCPRCAARLRDAAAPPADDARSGVAAALAEAFGARPGEVAPEPDADPAARPVVSIANLLQRMPELAAAPASSHDRAVASADPAVASPPGMASEPASPADAPAPAPAPATDGDAPAAAATIESAPTRRSAGRPAPSFVRRRTGTHGKLPARKRWPMPAAIAALAVLLCLQWLLADRARLAADPGWRPLVARACAVLGCSLPPWHEPAAFALLERDVRPHPEAADALRITASFRNEAPWAQRWPDVVLTLSDIDGRPLGVRAFTASEYLGGEPPSALVDSGQGAVIRMDVLEPGPGAVGFAFDFR